MAYQMTYARYDAEARRRRTAKALKTTQALVFLGLGGWCLMRHETTPV